MSDIHKRRTAAGQEQAENAPPFLCTSETIANSVSRAGRLQIADPLVDGFAASDLL
jgi:hypothetical protein